MSRAMNFGFQLYIWQYTSPKEHFDYGYSHSNAQLSLFTVKIFVLSQIGSLQAA